MKEKNGKMPFCEILRVLTFTLSKRESLFSSDFNVIHAPVSRDNF